MSGALAIGIGCRRGVAAAAIVSLVHETLAAAALPLADATLFTIDAKAKEVGLTEAADTLGRPLVLLTRDTLATIVTPTQSAMSQRRFGICSIAESAALAGAGSGAELAVRRVARDGVTCAVAHVRS